MLVKSTEFCLSNFSTYKLSTPPCTKYIAKGKTVDGTQELLALGLSNVFGSFISSMPMTSGMSRTALNYASGVQTPLSGLYTGGLLLITLAFLTDVFRYIPKSVLAAILMTAMMHMIDIEGIKSTWRSRRKKNYIRYKIYLYIRISVYKIYLFNTGVDMVPLLITLFACLFLGLEYGILIGVFTNVLFILYATARPKIDISVRMVFNQYVLVVVPDQSLVFSAAEHTKEKILRHVDRNSENVDIIVIDGNYVQSIDVTVAKVYICIMCVTT